MSLNLAMSHSFSPLSPAYRVHRYARDDGEEWVMWFQGRDSGIDEEVRTAAGGWVGYRMSSPTHHPPDHLPTRPTHRW